MADKTTNVDVTALAAALARKTGSQYRVESFKNQDGGFSAALIDNQTGSVTLQANRSSVEDAQKALGEAVAEGNLVFLDRAVTPAVETQEVPEQNDAPTTDKEKTEANRVNSERARIFADNAEATRRAGDLDDGYRAVRTGDAEEGKVEQSVSVSVPADSVPAELAEEAKGNNPVRKTSEPKSGTTV